MFGPSWSLNPFSVREETVHKAFFKLSVTSAKAPSLTYICVVFDHVDQASFCVLIVLQPTSMYRITVLCRWYISLQMELSSTWRRKNYRMNIKYLNVMWNDPSWECCLLRCIQNKCVNLSSYSHAFHYLPPVKIKESWHLYLWCHLWDFHAELHFSTLAKAWVGIYF